MEKAKKIWFTALSRRLWIPISFEGWGVTLAFALGLFLIYKVNGVSDKVAFKFSRHWPILLELGLLVAPLLWVSRGHVKKKY
jgi:hypothetical protein